MQNNYSQRERQLNLKHWRLLNHYGDGLSLLSTNNTLIFLPKTVSLLYLISNSEEHLSLCQSKLGFRKCLSKKNPYAQEDELKNFIWCFIFEKQNM